MDDVICLGRRSCRASFAFSSYFSRLVIGTFYSIQVFWKDGILEKDMSRQKSHIYFVSRRSFLLSDTGTTSNGKKIM